MRKTNNSQPRNATVTTRRNPSDNGDGERGTVNARTNQTTTQTVSDPAMAIADSALEAASNVAHIAPGKGRRKSLINAAAMEVSKSVQDKVQLMGQARQRLAEAFDLFMQGNDKAKEAQESANKAAIALYQGRTSGAVTADELSGALGDVFGYKAKSDGSPGKTPDGQGEAIRKRVVRAVQAFEYGQGEEASRFFDGLPRDDINGLLNGLEHGTRSIFTLYEDLADLRKKANEGQKPASAFDPKAIAKLIDALSEEGAAQHFVDSPALVRVYGELINAINFVDEQAAELAETKQAA